MTQRSVKKLVATMKIDAKGKNDLNFVECQAKIISIVDIETRFGDKVVMNLKSEAIEGEFAIFVNNYSMEKLIEAYGSNDKNFIGKLVNLKKETDETFDKEMIVTYPTA